MKTCFSTRCLNLLVAGDSFSLPFGVSTFLSLWRSFAINTDFAFNTNFRFYLKRKERKKEKDVDSRETNLTFSTFFLQNYWIIEMGTSARSCPSVSPFLPFYERIEKLHGKPLPHGNSLSQEIMRHDTLSKREWEMTCHARSVLFTSHPHLYILLIVR